MVSHGFFKYTLQKKYNNNITIEVLSTGYTTDEQKIEFQDNKHAYELHVVLKKNKITELKEILVVAKKNPIKIKNDTITYNINAFKDGTEKKVEDILKKLPGIDVNKETGLIRYNGKLIETVNLDGDNLFGYNYTTGTKNINADIIEAVEAIENYSENKLIKGIDKEGKVALNLKLKKDRTDISGDVDLGSGLFDTKNTYASNSSINILGINKLYKSFLTLSHNNIGENASPFNYNNAMNNLEQIREFDLFAYKIIPELQTLNSFGINRANINNQFYSNYNSIFNLNEKLKTKVNLYLLDDAIQSEQLSQNKYTLDNEIFFTFDNTSATKKPKQYRGDVELKYNTSKTSLLVYDASFRQEKIKTHSRIMSNQDTDFNTFLFSKNDFIKQNLEFTKKLSSNDAFQLNMRHSTNTIKQSYNLTPLSLSEDENLQNIDVVKNKIEIKSKYLGSKNNTKYHFELGLFSENEPLISNLYNINNSNFIPIENGQNNLKYSKDVVFNQASLKKTIGKFNFSPKYKLSLLNQNLYNASLPLEESSNMLVFEPSLDVSFKINTTTSLNLNFGLHQNTNSISNLFTNKILINNRTHIQNTPSISFQKNQALSLSYNKNDLFNQFQFVLGVNYQKQKGNYFSNTTLNENAIILNYFFLPDETETIDFNFIFSKLIPSLSTNIKISSLYLFSNYSNIINNSQLRNNTINQFFNTIFLKTTFDSKINFEDEFGIKQNKISSSIEIANTAIENKFKCIYKPLNNLTANFTFDYFKPTTNNQPHHYFFLDSSISYKPNNKKWELSMSSSNLLNETYLSQIQNTDFSTNNFRNNLLNRYFIVHYQIKF